MDPSENNDISAAHPDIVQRLLKRLEEVADTMVEPMQVRVNRL